MSDAPGGPRRDDAPDDPWAGRRVEDETAFDDELEPLPLGDPADEQRHDVWSPVRGEPEQEEVRAAWGSWKQDRALNRRKVLRAVVSVVVISVLAGITAYGCSILRGPRQLGLNVEVGGFVLLPPDDQDAQLAGRLEAAGATGPVAGRYRGPGSEVVFLVGVGATLPAGVVDRLLPAVTGTEREFPGRGGPMTCAVTASGSRCVWTKGDLVGGSTATGTPPEVLQAWTRDLRAGAVRG